MKAKDLKNSILQLAVEGKLVPQDPADEDASVLVERIRKEKHRLISEGKAENSPGAEKALFIPVPMVCPMRSAWTRRARS
jgi:type I restriction enzyme S subunit